MTTALAGQETARPDPGALIESVIVKGDLSKLSAAERTQYYISVCESAKLNPLTRPFEYLTLNNRLVLYARKDATDQLRSIHGISVTDLNESERDGLYIITAKVQNADGRTDMAKGAVNIASLKGEALANALMKCETKAKRRATLAICGLGFLDETEIETIPEAANGAPKRTRQQITDEANKKRQDLRDAEKDILQIDNLATLERYEQEVLTPEFMASLGMKQYAVQETYERRHAELANEAAAADIQHDLDTGEILERDEQADQSLCDELIERIEAAETAEAVMATVNAKDFETVFRRLPDAMQTTVKRFYKTRLSKVPAEA